MRIRFIIAVLFLIGTALPVAQSRAQTGDRLVVLGIASYRALEYDSAITHFQRALASRGRDSLVNNRQTDVLAYIGASQLLRGDSVAATNTFVRALSLDPRYRIDDLVFPPPVTSAFEVSRLSTAYLDMSTPPATTIRVRSGSLPIHLFASAPSDVTVSLVRSNGGTAHQIFAGPIKDSLDVKWDGTDASGNPIASGSYQLLVRSTRPAMFGRENKLSLTVEALRVDTLAHPAAPAAMRTSTSGFRPTAGVGALILGTLAGGAAVFLPDIIGKDDSAMPARYVVGGTLGVAGVIGFLGSRQQGRRTRTDAIAHETRMDAWRKSVESVKQENARRLAAPQLRITITPLSNGADDNASGTDGDK